MSSAAPEKSDVHGKRTEPLDLEAAIRRKVLSRDSRYELGAYFFLYEALAFTQKQLGRSDPDLESAKRHVTGQELLEGIRAYAAHLFGPLAPTVFRSWGIHKTEDFGRIVFNLAECNLLGKTEQDQIEDFADGFDFDTAFDGPMSVTLQ